MKKVLFVCSAGMSTSLLVEKTKKAADERGLSIDIIALSEAESKSHLNDCSVILLGPQVRFLLGSIKKSVEGKDIKVDVIDSVAYGRMDGDKVLDQILSITN